MDESSDTYKPGNSQRIPTHVARLLHVGRQRGTSRHRRKYHGRHLHLEISLAGRLHLHYGLEFRQPALEERDSILSGDYIVTGSPLRAYEQFNPAGCTSAVAPTGTASGSGTVLRRLTAANGNIGRRSLLLRKAFIPTQRYASKPNASYEMRAYYEAQLWNDREYVAGQHGEAVPIRAQAHLDNTQDGFPDHLEVVVLSALSATALFFCRLQARASSTRSHPRIHLPAMTRQRALRSAIRRTRFLQTASRYAIIWLI